MLVSIMMSNIDIDIRYRCYYRYPKSVLVSIDIRYWYTSYDLDTRIAYRHIMPGNVVATGYTKICEAKGEREATRWQEGCDIDTVHIEKWYRYRIDIRYWYSISIFDIKVSMRGARRAALPVRESRKPRGTRTSAKQRGISYNSATPKFIENNYRGIWV